MSPRLQDNRIRIGLVGIVLAVTVVLATLQYQSLPFISSALMYNAKFVDAGGLLPGDQVEVAGLAAGKVHDISLDGDQVNVRFTLKESITLGDSTTAAVKTGTLLGRKSLALTPDGSGSLRSGAVIPIERTTAPYSLNDALGDLTDTVSELDTDQLNSALNAMSGTLADTPESLRATLDGVTRLSQSLNARDESLEELLARARSVTGVLAERGDQINTLLLDGNQLLGELERRRDAISELIVNISAVSRQLTGFVQDNQQQIGPTLQKLNAVTALLIKNGDNINAALTNLGPYATSLGEAVASGPYFQSYVQNYGGGKLFDTLIDALVDPSQLPKDLRNLIDPLPTIEFDHPPTPR